MKINYTRLIVFFIGSQAMTFYLNFLSSGKLLHFSDGMAWGAGFMAFIAIKVSILIDLPDDQGGS